jgi:beta-lactamase regulating signal transducer with metallopeptidase domain
MWTLLAMEPPAAASLLPHAAALARQLAQAAVSGALLALAVWAVCRLAPHLPAGLRCALWWLASLKLIAALAWPAPLAVPLLPSAVATTAAGAWLVRPEAAARPEPIAAGGARIARLSIAPSSAPGVRTSLLRKQRPVAARPAATTALAAPGAPAFTASQAFPAFPALSAPPASLASPPVTPPAPWWTLALAALWIAGLARQLALGRRELRHVRRLLAGSAPANDPQLRRLAAELCARLRLPAVDLRIAAPELGVTAPFTTGALHPVVVLPASCVAELSRQELAMTLMHELMHVRRRDLLWGWVPAIATRLFFFLPTAALAAREYALAREAACDAAVLRQPGAAPAAYARVLVRLGARLAGARRGTVVAEPSPTGATVAGAAASIKQLKRRLEMLQHLRHDVPARPVRLARLGVLLLLLLAAAALAPVHIVAAAGPQPALGTDPQDAPEVPEPPAAPPAPPAPAPRPAPPATAPSTPPAPAAPAAVPPPPATAPSAPPALAAPTAVPQPPTAPSPPTPAAPQTPPAPPAVSMHTAGLHFVGRHAGGRFVHDPGGRREDDAYVLLQHGSDVTMSGDIESVERARELQRRTGGGDLLWVRRQGKAYVIRDAATLREVREIFRPQQELGARQGALGARQGELGARQGALGGRQGALGAQQGKLGAEQARLAVELAGRALADVGGGGERLPAGEKRRQEDSERQERLHREMEKLGEQQRELGDQQRELGKQQAELGEQQRQLGRQQEVLGREQEKAGHEARARLRTLLDKAIAQGTAQEVK